MLTSVQIHVLGLMMKCPLDNPLPECPFNYCRNKSLTEQVEELLLYTEEELEELFN